MITIVSHLSLFLLIAYFNGKVFIRLLQNNEKNSNNYEILVFGIIFTAFVAQFLNFFIPLNNYVIYSNLILILLLNFNKINCLYSKLFKKNNIILIFLIFFITILIYGSEFSDDLNHYHGGYIINTDNLNYTFGLNFLHHHYGYSSIWLILHSYFNFNSSILQDIHILNGIIFLSLLGLIINEIYKNVKNKIINNYILIIIFFLFFLLIKYTRLKEFGIDKPGLLIAIFFFYYYIKYFLVEKKISIIRYGNLVLISFFLFCIKIIYLPFLIISVVLYATHLIKEKNIKILNSKFNIFLFFILFSYLTKNIVISGCLIYPVKFLCLNSLPWNSLNIVQNLTLNTEIFNKSYSHNIENISPQFYIKNFNWLSTWYDRNYQELLELFLTVVLCILFSIFSISKIKTKKVYYNALFIVISSILFLSIFIALKTPVIRMFHHLFIIFGIYIILYILNKKKILIKKKVFLSFLLLFFCFSLTKNIFRIHENNFMNNPKKLIKDIGWYQKPKKMNIGNFNYYNGWNDKYPIGNENLKKYNHKKILIFDIIYK